MWRYLLISCLLAQATQQAYSESGNSLVSFVKVYYTNQTMAELGLPESNYAPSNFYTVSLVRKQSVVV
jgi:hypothetical protein